MMKRTFWKEPNRQMTDYYWFEECFSKEEIENIKEIAEQYEKVGALTGSSEEETIEDQDLNTRSSTIRWLPYDDETAWIYEKLGACMSKANDEMWGFDWEGWSEDIQFTEYHASAKGHYDWHQDMGSGSMAKRKLSAVLLLNSEYEGGELEIWNTTAKDLPKKAGNVVCFPSYMLHRVAPVTKGTRQSVVIWAGGKHYR
jgi:PKHD-type hydroxylase